MPDTSRRPSFVDGFWAIERRHDRWPEPGANVVVALEARRSRHGHGEGRRSSRSPRVVVDVLDGKMSGRWGTVTPFTPDEDGSEILVEIDYELNEGGPLIRWPT